MGYKIVIPVIAIVAVLFASGITLQESFASHENKIDENRNGYLLRFTGNNDSPHETQDLIDFVENHGGQWLIDGAWNNIHRGPGKDRHNWGFAPIGQPCINEAGADPFNVQCGWERHTAVKVNRLLEFKDDPTKGEDWLKKNNKVVIVTGYSFGGGAATFVTTLTDQEARSGLNIDGDEFFSGSVEFNLVWLDDPVSQQGRRIGIEKDCYIYDVGVPCESSAPERIFRNNVKFVIADYQTSGFPPTGIRETRDLKINYGTKDSFVKVAGEEFSPRGTAIRASGAPVELYHYDCEWQFRAHQIELYGDDHVTRRDGGRNDTNDGGLLQYYKHLHQDAVDIDGDKADINWWFNDWTDTTASKQIDHTLPLDNFPYAVGRIFVVDEDAEPVLTQFPNERFGKFINGVLNEVTPNKFYLKTATGWAELDSPSKCHGIIAFDSSLQTKVIDRIKTFNNVPTITVSSNDFGEIPDGAILEINEGDQVSYTVSASDSPGGFNGDQEDVNKMKLDFYVNPEISFNSTSKIITRTHDPSPTNITNQTTTNSFSAKFVEQLETFDGKEGGTLIEKNYQVEDNRFPCNDRCTAQDIVNGNLNMASGAGKAKGAVGAYDFHSLAINVTNVPPTVSGFATFQGVDLKLLLKTTDPSEDDTLAGFNYTINWGDDSPIQNIQSSIPGNTTDVFSHSYTPGIYNVTVHATDKDNGMSDEFSIEVSTPFVKLLKLINDLKEDGTLNKGNANSFTSKVNTVIESVNKQNYNPVCNVSNALINEIKQGFEKPGKLSIAISDDLIEKIKEEREPFGCNGGVIDVVKLTIPDGHADQFTFTGDVSGTISDGEKIRLGNLTSGTYSTTEIVSSGHTLANIFCVANDYTKDLTTQTATIYLQENEYAVCVFFNVIDEETESSFAGRGFGSATSDTASSGIRLHSSNLSSPQTSDDLTDDKKGSGGDEHLTRPTFGVSHETFETIVDSGFRFNDQSFTINDNHHTPFAQQTVNIGEVNSFEAKIYADKRLKIQEFLFGIPNVGEAHLAELGVEVWYDYNGEIEEVKAIQKSNVIDKETIVATHEKTKCQALDIEQKCDTTNVSMVFLEPLKDKVMAVKAIDYKGRYQITYLNEGVDIAGESLNPMQTYLIPSNVRDQGLIKVTQLAKYSPYWQSDEGRLFEMNSFGSFKEINQTFERFQDTGTAYTRLHSGFGGVMAYELNRATEIFDGSELLKVLPDFIPYTPPEISERMTDEMDAKMIEQEAIAKKILEESKVQARW